MDVGLFYSLTVFSARTRLASILDFYYTESILNHFGNIQASRIILTAKRRFYI